MPYQVFAASDGHIIVAVGNDAQFVKFCEVAGRPDLARDPRFARNADRVRHRATLVPLLEAIVREQPIDWWVEALEAATVPCGPINDIAHALADPQVAARELRVDLPHPLAGQVPLVANPIKLSATPADLRARATAARRAHRRDPARYGCDLGDDAIARLRAEGIV